MTTSVATARDGLSSAMISAAVIRPQRRQGRADDGKNGPRSVGGLVTSLVLIEASVRRG